MQIRCNNYSHLEKCGVFKYIFMLIALVICRLLVPVALAMPDYHNLCQRCVRSLSFGEEKEIGRRERWKGKESSV
jgi:hypothetical protein